MTHVRKRLPETNLSSHGRGRGFESPIAHREKPLLSGGFFASGTAAPCERFCVQGRGQRQQALMLRLAAGLWGVEVERFAPRVGCGVGRAIAAPSRTPKARLRCARSRLVAGFADGPELDLDI